MELSVDIWDWTAPANDLALFEAWARDLHDLEFDRLELSVAWKTLQPSKDRLDLTWLRQRHEICRRYGLGMRLRINSYYAGQMPTWYQGDIWLDCEQKPVIVGPIPSINNERFWADFAPLCTAIATELKGEDVLYNPFIGVHAELKWADWWTFDASSMALWRKSIEPPRPEWLRRIVPDHVDLPTTPTVPPNTNGTPDLTPANRAFIAFREWTWRRAMDRFVDAIHTGDPHARISSPLGESFRMESAFMSNQDYWGLTRHSSQVVHSYDFYVHPGNTPLWYVSSTIASFKGITGLPVAFEFDAPDTIQNNGYDSDVQKAVARAAFDAGAGLKFANFSYSNRLPSQWPVIQYAAELKREHGSEKFDPPRRDKCVLLFFSKWANYCYREKTEWLHEAQFGWWRLLTDLKISTRIICEDNLAEDLSGYAGIITAFSPRELLPLEDAKRLQKLEASMPHFADVIKAPSTAPPLDEKPATDTLQGANPHVFGFPLGYYYANGIDECLSHTLIYERLLKAGFVIEHLNYE